MSKLRFALAFVVFAIWAAAPAAAQVDDAAPAVTDAVVALQAEIMLLVELDAFESVPPLLAQVHREWVEYTDGMDRADLIVWLYEVDAEGAAAAGRLRAEGVPLGRVVSAVLSRLGPDERARIESGEPIGVVANQYAVALEELRVGVTAAIRSAGTTTTATDRRTDATASTASPATSTGSTSGMGASGGSSEIGGEETTEAPESSTPKVLLAALAAALVAMPIVSRRRSSNARAGASAQFDRLLDAGRRMTSALDRDEISRIAVCEAVALAGARHGAFIHVRSGSLALAHQDGGMVDERRLEDGILHRVATTGRSLRLVSNDEPAITALPAALLVVPVIGQGSVTGVVLVIRPHDAPFSEDEEAAIGRLAPMIGSALAAADAHGDVAQLTRTDALTGLANRRSLDADLVAAMASAVEGAHLGVAMIDVDHFKHFNDTNGHAAGDQALRAVAVAIRDSVRTGDIAYRYGGEEFSLLLRDVDPDRAYEVAERVRRSVERLVTPGAERQPGGRLTVSVGVALAVAGDHPDRAIQMADAALYEAKAAGRNRVVIATGEASVA